MKRIILCLSLFAVFESQAQQINPVPDYVFRNQMSVGRNAVTDTAAYFSVGPRYGAVKGMMPPIVSDTAAITGVKRNGLLIFSVQRNNFQYWDSINSRWTSITANVDTTIISTRAWRQKGVDSLANVVGNLGGLRWLIYGDSFSDNLTSDYVARVKNRLGLIATTKAVSGQRIFQLVDTVNSNLSSNPNFYDDFDILSIHIGVNDFAFSVHSLGSINSASGANDIAGKLKYILDTILAKKPTLKIFIITPPEANGAGVLYQAVNTQGWSLREMSLLYGQICNLYGVQLVDLYSLSQFNLKTISTFTTDGLHPSNPTGTNYIGDIVAQCFLSSNNVGKTSETYRLLNNTIPKYNGYNFVNTVFKDSISKGFVFGELETNDNISIKSTVPLFISSANSATSSFIGYEMRTGSDVDAFVKLRPNTGELRISSGRNASWGGNISFYTDTLYRAIIRSNGRMSIAAGADEGYQLDVNGTFRAKDSIRLSIGSFETYIGNGADAGTYKLQIFGSTYMTGNLLITNSQPLIIASSTVTTNMYGYELRDGSDIDGFMKHQANTGEMRFSSGRNSTWGGYMTFYLDTQEKMRLRNGELIIGGGSDAGAYALQVTGDIYNTATITTGAPTGGSVKPWRLGEAATVSPTSPNRTIRVEIDGTVYYLHAKTTND